jgi:hypothetical protein
MVRLVLGIAVGCVLGAKAGHERYEQILRVTSKAVDNPAVQGVAGFVQAKMSSVLPHRNWREPRRPDLGYLVDVEEILQGPAAALTSVSTSSINRRPSRPWWNQIVLPTSEQIRPRDGSPHHSTARIPRPGEDVGSSASPGRFFDLGPLGPGRDDHAHRLLSPVSMRAQRPYSGRIHPGSATPRGSRCWAAWHESPEGQQDRVGHRQKAGELGEQCRGREQQDE